MKEHPIVIIGAGVCGLSIAKLIQNQNPEIEPLLIEKSRGLGGRMATRRSEKSTFDHGAQFYQKTGMEFLHDLFLKTERVHTWSQFQGEECFASNLGMTDLAKELAKGLLIKKETRVIKLTKQNHLWFLETDQGEAISSPCVILTAPVPQALELLDQSAIAYPLELKSLEYTMALVLLLTLKQAEPLPTPYVEPLESDILSITDQHQKGVSASQAWTVVFKHEFSKTHFENDPVDTLTTAIEQVKASYPGIQIESSELKKWRYARPLKTWHSSFQVISRIPDLILAGDGFGGDRIEGAYRSAEATFQHLNLKKI